MRRRLASQPPTTNGSRTTAIAITTLNHDSWYHGSSTTGAAGPTTWSAWANSGMKN